MNTNIYVLALTDGCYYVGKSYDVESRYQHHIAGTGSKWTSLHPPVQILEIIPIDNPFEEDKYVKMYMAQYGIDKVRGGAYSTVILSEDQLYFLKKELWAVESRCIRCGRSNHYIKNCTAASDVYGYPITDNYVQCERCRRVGHSTSRCYAHLDVDGNEI